MYIHPINREEDLAAAEAHIREHGFGTLYSTVAGRPWATHLPMLVEPSAVGKNPWLLSGHMARANAQWRDLPDGAPVLATFLGPHAYISSSWYNHPNVSTWNYVSVHVAGRYRKLEGPAVLAHLRLLTDTYERASSQPAWFDNLPDDVLRVDLRGLVAFCIDVDEVSMAVKLSQNRDAANLRQMIAALESRNGPHDAAIARLMGDVLQGKL
jgi:transcriptional regulator